MNYQSVHRSQNMLKLPKIDDLTSHKSHAYFPGSPGLLPGLQGTTKNEKPGLTLNTEESAIIKGKRGTSLESRISGSVYPDEDPYFLNSTNKQNWILKKIEAQRETLQKKPAFLGLKDHPQIDSYRHNTKVSHLNADPTAINPYSPNSPPLRKKFPFEDTHGVSRSVNLGNTKQGKTGKFGFQVQAEAEESLKKKIEMKLGSDSSDYSSSYAHMKTGMSPNSLKSPYTRNKFPSLSPINEGGMGAEGEKVGRKVNIELIMKVDEKIQNMFMNIENKSELLKSVKEYLETTDLAEALNIEGLFFDTRMRRNLKTYVMLEKTSVFALLCLLSEEAEHGGNDHHVRNICHYLYGNFLNFVETVASKMSLIPGSGHTPAIERLKNIYKKKVQEIDRSFTLEQINKLLLKLLRTSLKHATNGDRYTKIELLLEKIDFGLMLNYSDELKGIFYDLITKNEVNLQMKNDPTPTVEGSPKKKSTIHRPEKTRIGTNERKNSLESSPAKLGGADKDYHLPPAVPKPGHEGKPIYSLVLDMDETLIHFEEVAGKGRFFVRPFAEKFLQEMSELYEVTIFTAGVQEYADAVLNILDPQGHITHRLYRHHVSLHPVIPGVIKDLSKIGRDLSKTIIVDNVPENFKLQEDNGIEITSWYNDPYDKELLELMPFLKDLVINQVEDVRRAVKRYKDSKKKGKKY